MKKLFLMFVQPVKARGNKMTNKNLSVIAIVSILLLSGFIARDSVPPKVTETNPQNGALNVDPALTEIWVKFDKPMADKSWSWSYEDKNKFPELTGKPYYNDSATKCMLPVKLEPGKEYIIWINTQKNKGFKDREGNPAEPYKFIFKTR
jgi:hypothetical protein